MPFHAVVLCIHPQWASCHSPIHSYPSALTQFLWGWAPCGISSITFIKKMLFPQELFALALIIPVILEKTQWLLSQRGRTQSRRWCWGKRGKCLDWLRCWRKKHPAPGDFTCARAFLLIHLLLSAPEQLQRHLVLSFSAHSSVSMGTWME